MESITSYMEQAPAYTILRIKRRRDEEPLDALVVEGKRSRKRTKASRGVFQYAETIDEKAWNDEQVQKDIQEKISRLTSQGDTKADDKARSTAQTPDRQSPFVNRHENNAGRRYTIIEAEPPISPQKLAPPVLISAKDQETNTPPDFKMYDAVLSAPEEEPALDPEMEKFQSMLSDYLKINEVDINNSAQNSSAIGNLTLDSTMKSPSSGDGDYVWDVFYHRPATLTEWNEIANVGTLTGFPAVNSESYSSDSEESEKEDEADEDSNDEEYYKNDYPEDEEEGSSDEFHEDSDHEDMIHGRQEYDVRYDNGIPF